jgi:glucose/arabinose dehydrogenase
MKNHILTLLALFFSIHGSIIAQNIELELKGSGFQSPVDIKNAGDDRLFIVEQSGKIKILNTDGTVPSPAFLDVSSLISTGGERGLLSVAFPPDYVINGEFYIYYTAINGSSTIARYSVSNTDSNIADPSGTALLNFSQPFANHNGGCMQFGSDGFLYIASGDGGNGNDPGDRAQDRSTLLGKLLRIDVNTTGSSTPYGIPSSNQFASTTGRDEIFAMGLRNPWKFSFDSATDDLWIADVGQNATEEINRVPITNTTANYGWRCYEGNTTNITSGNCPMDSSLVFPIATYDHTGNGLDKCSITGGYVYRGSDNPDLIGKYFFADFCSDEIGILNTDNGAASISYSSPFPNELLSSFGEDNNNELYVCGLGSGNVYKVNSSTASIEDKELAVEIFPNPTSNILNVRLNTADSFTTTIYDLNGRLLLSKEQLHNSFNLDLSPFKSGRYFLQIDQGGTKKSVSFIKK